MAATEQEVDALSVRIADLQQKHNTEGATLSGDELRAIAREVRELQRQREAMIREDCGACLKCGDDPTGLIQTLAVGGSGLDGFGIRCSRPECSAQARHIVLEKARAIWNTRPERMDVPDGNGAAMSAQKNLA